ncbi:MAG: hypothetical protein WD690_06760 [Vicinamibacterales bacterium]
MKERLHDGPRHQRPAIIVSSRELFAGSLANDLEKPWMQRTVWKEASELPNNAVGLLLKPEHFQAYAGSTSVFSGE